jgi:SAM-dependent methyltransferase
MFEALFQKNYSINEQDIFCFCPEDTGDYFDEDDLKSWRNDRLKHNWNNASFLENPIARHLMDELIKHHPYVIDLACGPGMGLIPSIKQLVPDFPCLATDAKPLVLQEWARYLKSNSIDCPPKLAQFSALQLPFHSDSVEAFSSFIGLSSTRQGNVGYEQALSELHRTLKDGGCFYAIENEWTNVPTILELFKKMGQEPWNCFLEPQISWHDRFIDSGLEIVYEEPYLFRKLRENDNDLGEAASRFGVDIGLQFTAFIVRKR